MGQDYLQDRTRKNRFKLKDNRFGLDSRKKSLL